MGFRRQLILGHAAIVLVTIITGAAVIIALRVNTARLERVAHSLGQDAIAAERLRVQAEHVVATSRGYLLTGDAIARTRFDDAVKNVYESLGELEARREDLSDDIAHIERDAKTYVAAAERAARERSESDDPKQVIPFFERTLAPAREEFEQALASFVEREQAAFDSASHDARMSADRTQTIVTLTTGLAILIGIALAVISIRRLNGLYAREREATEAAKRAVTSREELLAIVSHDLRNPLNAVKLGSSLLLEAELPQRARKSASVISTAATHMNHLIEQLLDLAKLDRGKLELALAPCEVENLLEATEGMFRLRASDAGIDFAVRGEHARVTADRERVLQVLSNLVSNALRYTPSGGKVTVSARAEGDLVRFEVSDTGSGIPEAQRAHVFDRYWQGEPAERGTRGSLGLGLYICKQIVVAHKGEIGVTSTPGQGSTFWFTLPVTAA